MNPTFRVSVLTLALVTAGLSAQTAAPSQQRPVRTVESVRPLAKVQQDAARLDTALQRGLQKRGEQALPVVDDATFVRRAYLEVIGRIPTLAETESFLADQGADKRSTLLDRLLDSPGRTSHFANFWFDLGIGCALMFAVPMR